MGDHPRIGDLRMLCAPDEAILVLYREIPGAGLYGKAARNGYPAQTMLAELAGVG